MPKLRSKHVVGTCRAAGVLQMIVFSSRKDYSRYLIAATSFKGSFHVLEEKTLPDGKIEVLFLWSYKRYPKFPYPLEVKTNV